MRRPPGQGKHHRAQYKGGGKGRQHYLVAPGVVPYPAGVDGRNKHTHIVENAHRPHQAGEPAAAKVIP